MELALIRIAFYGLQLLISFVLLALCATRLQYTLNIPLGDTLNGGRNFYDPVIIELLVAAIIALGWCGFMIYLYFQENPNSIVRTYREELIGLGFVWLLWLGGSAAATNIWANAIATCQQFQACQILSALLGICWIGFTTLVAMIGVNLKLRKEYRGLNAPLARSGSGRSTKESLGV
ncbi:hypothetical protein PM082_004354 [Marasmius tenuissimus]|nr:hypothetical protein PM082_004354 [Marasmius tenuissimus]